MTRFCIICGKELTGRQKKTCSIECRRIWKNKCNREWSRNNQERVKEIARKYRQNNLEKILEYRQNNLEKTKEYNCEYRQNNREEMNERDCKRYRRFRGLSEDADLHKESSIERIMREWLQKNNIEFISQCFINLENSTKTHVDFYIPEVNVCLYVDGDYWHSLPGRQESDVRINEALEEMGYNVIRITETEILSEWRVLK